MLEIGWAGAEGPHGPDARQPQARSTRGGGHIAGALPAQRPHFRDSPIASRLTVTVTPGPAAVPAGGYSLSDI